MDGTEIRIARPEDLEEILDVCSVSLGWTDAEFDRALFTWKHDTNPFGRSLIMVAETSGGLVAVRPFMRWRFRRGDETLTAVRAVDTATHPDARGQGLFRTLTETGLEVLRDEGAGIVFNTPNDKSRPGYLKMGWHEAGHIPLGIRLRSLAVIPRLSGARVAAEKPSLPTTIGLSVDDGLAASSRERTMTSNRWATDHDDESLLWRFARGPIQYRWIPGPAGSGTVIRARRRGSATELLVAATVGKADDAARTAAIKTCMRRVGADYCLTAARFPRTVPTPRLGPLLTMREITIAPRPDEHVWQPGDIELF